MTMMFTESVDQSKTMSMIEAWTNAIIGFILSSLIVVYSAYYLFDLKIDVYQGAAWTSLFTAVSIVRGYCVRRFFNWVGQR